jgi:hypothetical protein
VFSFRYSISVISNAKVHKPVIENSGADTATVTVHLPHTQAGQVVVTVDGLALPALTLSNKTATFQVEADNSFADGDSLTIGVQGHPYTPLEIDVRDAS